MKILLSAFACEPNLGSEPGIGWNWAKCLSEMGHSVVVITRERHKNAIQKALNMGLVSKIEFHYFDLFGWKKWESSPGGIYVYYVLWQWFMIGIAKKLDQENEFDIVHHLTYGTIRQPSFLWRLKRPFYFGPAGGGEHAPLRLRRSYPIAGFLVDAARDLSNFLIRFDPLMRLTYAAADRIAVTSAQSRAYLPRSAQRKSSVLLAIGCDAAESVQIPTVGTRSQRPSRSLRIVFAGRMLYWKGMHLGIQAVSTMVRNGWNIELSMVGAGPAAADWQALCQKLNINHCVKWFEWLPRSEVLDLFRQSDVLLLPSFHDSGGAVVLEALINGLPVVCLDIGGPAAMVDAECGFVVQTTGVSPEQVVARIARSLEEIGSTPECASSRAQAAQRCAASQTWQTRVSSFYAVK